MAPYQEYAGKAGRIHRQDEQRVRETDLAEDGDDLVVEKDEDRSDTPGQAKRQCQERDNCFCFDRDFS